MQESTKRKIWRWLGYTMFFMAAFVYFIYRTFPYKQLFDRFSMDFQRQAKLRLKIGSLQPYWLSGVEANNIIIRKPVKKGIAAVKIKYVRAHASLFSLIFQRISADFYAEVAKGTIDGSVSQSGSKMNVKVNIKRLSLNALREKRRRRRRVRRSKKGKSKKAVAPKNDSLLATLFAPVYGRLKAKIRLKVPLPGAPASKPPKPRKSRKNRRSRRSRRSRRRSRRRTRRRSGRRTRGVDLTRLTGTIKVNLRNFSIGPGEFPTAQMGDLPVPLLRLGKFVLRIKITKGEARITRCESNGADGAIKMTGSIRLRQNMRYAVFRGKLEFKINKSFIDSLEPTSVLKTGLGLLGPAPRGGFYRYRLRIPLGGGRATFRRF